MRQGQSHSRQLREETRAQPMKQDSWRLTSSTSDGSLPASDLINNETYAVEFITVPRQTNLGLVRLRAPNLSPHEPFDKAIRDRGNDRRKQTLRVLFSLALTNFKPTLHANICNDTVTSQTCKRRYLESHSPSALHQR